MNLSQKSPFYPVEDQHVIFADENVLAFYDRYPVSNGHALVIPMQPVESIFELSPDIQAELWDMARRVRLLLTEKYHPDGFNIGINDGPAAGQTVLHSHIHIIPRYNGDVADPRGGIRNVIPAKARYW
jgi:diadenosine tetraphosphate (Ap4A) HIT family hydrolase